MKNLPRILVGGSNGYIGTKLCEYLKKRNYDFETFDINLFSKCLLYHIKEKYKTSFKDVRDINDDYLKKFDVYIHLPGISNNPVDNFKNKKKTVVVNDTPGSLGKSRGANNDKNVTAALNSKYLIRCIKKEIRIFLKIKLILIYLKTLIIKKIYSWVID